MALVDEVKLLYESLRPIAVDWNCLQAQLWQQYSRTCNTREQLFQTWRSFHFDKNSETMESYVTCIKWVAALLGYGEPQVLKVFENTLPSRLYWVLFPVEDLKQAVETAKKITTRRYRQTSCRSLNLNSIHEYYRQYWL